ncbi:hypothetical protein [Staphylococcus warneri]|uniref:hypothetical protein n=1 Tax=Staphylococcus warneri TaxID=1292 RepID=UPI0007942DDA|nr:hypothetical protein [Staphylococcus warneri]KTW16725.1 phage protein [Staphylococcus warneri]MCC8990139.1 hypothetical protein [Staphylococcus sp.]DAT54098.1 MAG TPA: helicase loader [Caudoviricetes sp.]
MITLQEIKQNLECSDVYAQKLIDYAQGDDKVLENLYYQKLAERRIRPAIVEY